ncbi:VOC family protein [Terrarubrum flagellatum]|uniref:VOC family protein n=1 Tax=Terrirubrum flagellatum TaxID=2895980 RepID=UPI003144FEE6
MPMVSLDLDHVHITVSDREASADWYERVLGLRRDARVPHWASDPTQPLFIGSGRSRSCIALFQRRPDDPPRAGDHTVGFAVSGADFLAFAARLDALSLTHRDGEPLTRANTVDHGAAWSFHFLDPDGNRIELTSYDHEMIAAALTA